MKYCGHCGNELVNAEAVFCPGCGVQVTKNLQTEYAKIRVNKSNFRIVKEFLLENIILFIILIFIGFVLLTFLPPLIGWLYLISAGAWLYIYPVYTGKKETDINTLLTSNLANSDVIFKKYLEDRKVKTDMRKEKRRVQEEIKLQEFVKELNEGSAHKDATKTVENTETTNVIFKKYLEDRKVKTDIHKEKRRVQEEIKLQEFVKELNEGSAHKNATKTAESIETTNVEGNAINIQRKKKSILNAYIYLSGTIPVFIALYLFMKSQDFIAIGSGVLLICLIISLLSSLVYYMPTLINRGNSKWPIFFVNLLLGWSVIGWVICLIWSTNDNHRWDMLQVQKQLGTNIYINK